MREAARRTKASPSSFCSLRRFFSENRSLSTRIRLSLANSMCDSRLLFGVESWPCCTGSAFQKLPRAAYEVVAKWLRSMDSSEVRSCDKVSDCSDDAEQSTERKELEQYVLHRNKITPLLMYVLEGLLLALASGSTLPVVSWRCCSHHTKSGWYIDRGVRFSFTLFTFTSGSHLADLGDPQLTPLCRRVSSLTCQSITHHESREPFYKVLLVWYMWQAGPHSASSFYS